MEMEEITEGERVRMERWGIPRTVLRLCNIKAERRGGTSKRNQSQVGKKKLRYSEETLPRQWE